MRSILNVSLPAKTKSEIEKRAKKSGKSLSAYVLHALEVEKNLITEDELLQMSAQADADYKKGKVKVLKSLKNLLKR